MSVRKLIEDGNIALSRGLLAEAERSFRSAQDLLKTIPASDPANADCLYGLARVAFEKSQHDQALDLVNQSMDISLTWFGTHSPQYANSAHLMADIYRIAGELGNAREYYQMALAYWQNSFGPTHAQTCSALSRLVELSLENEQTPDFEDIHQRAIASYQATQPVGQWAKFIHIEELANRAIARGDARKVERIYQKELAFLKRFFGGQHKEIAALLSSQSEMLKKMKLTLSAAMLAQHAGAIGALNQDALVTTNKEAYPLSPSRAFAIIERMLTSRGSISAEAPDAMRTQWWQIKESKTEHAHLVAWFKYDKPIPHLELDIKCTAHGDGTAVTYTWKDHGLHPRGLTRSVQKYTFSELHQTLGLAPRSDITLSPVAKRVAPSWPSPQDYNEAIQIPQSNLEDQQLKSGIVELNQLGLPRPHAGSYATVYRVSNTDRFAVKLFHIERPDLGERYKYIEQFIAECRLPYFVPTHYMPQGIRVNNKWYPALKMAWVDGSLLSTFVSDHANEPDLIGAITIQFCQLMQTLQKLKVAHGDLQHGNILVSDGRLILVDYDGMYVPAFQGQQALEIGHRNFQHSGRNPGHFGPFIDNFSAWVIYTSLVCVRNAPGVWDQLEGGDDCLLFRQKDFQNPVESQAFNLLCNHDNPQVREVSSFLRKLCTLAADQIPPLSNNLQLAGLA